MAITICQILSGTTSSLYYTKKNHQWKTSDRSHRKFYKVVQNYVVRTKKSITYNLWKQKRLIAKLKVYL